MHRSLQRRFPEGLGHAQEHEHACRVVDQTLAERAVVQSVGVEVATHDDPRRAGAEADHHVVTVRPGVVRARADERL